MTLIYKMHISSFDNGFLNTVLLENLHSKIEMNGKFNEYSTITCFALYKKLALVYYYILIIAMQIIHFKASLCR